MQDHFLREIKIVDYKCFKNFIAKDFKRINLISGRNNVGKTALMETLFINLHHESINHLTYALDQVTFSRNNLEYVEKSHSTKDGIENIKFYSSISNKNEIKFSHINENGIKEYLFEINGNKINLNINNFSFQTTMKTNVLHLDSFGLTNSNLNMIYESIQKNDKESELNKIIAEFDQNIKNFKIIGEKPQCKTTDGIYRNINEFGDGLKHYIGIVCSLYACENGQLFIDEIDNGIHYTQLEKLWEIIFTISKEVNCQVFTTTHSKEMINAYAKVSQKLEEEDISFIELGRNKDNEVKSITMDYERFQREISSGNEIRGW